MTAARGSIQVGATPIRVSEATLFAFDDVLIPFTHNLRLQMERPEKHPSNPVMDRGGKGAPDEGGVQFYGSIVRDQGKFRLWYVAMAPELASDPRRVTGWRQAYAESHDGIHWEKPKLGLVEYNGSRDNNLVLIEPAPLGAINLKVICDPDDPDPSRRYKMTNNTWPQEDNERGRGAGTLAPLFSEDGLRWRLAVDAIPVDGLLPAEGMALPRYHFEGSGGLYKWRGMYYATGQTGEDVVASGTSGRAAITFRSHDFVHWSEAKTLSFVREGQHRSFEYGSGEEAHEGVSVWHRGNVLVGLYGIWRGHDEWAGVTIDLGLLVSNDGIKFREPIPECVFLERGQDGEWDQGGLIQGQGFENVGEETYIWYGAWDPRFRSTLDPDGTGRERCERRGGLGLATLVRDRFGHLTPKNSETRASLVTAAMEVAGSARLWVNVDGLSQDAAVSIELVDETDRPLPGYSGDSAAMVRQAGLRVPVVWKHGDRVHGLDQPFAVKITFEGNEAGSVKLYALYVGE